MSKRFTETAIWLEDWFIDMPNEYKLLWNYIKDNCNHAGIWKPNKKLFEAIIGVKVDLKKALDYMNREKNRILILASGHWYIIDFFIFQYGASFNINNRVHKSIKSIYLKEEIDLTSIRGLIEVKEGVKDKDKDIVINNINNTNNTVEDGSNKENTNIKEAQKEKFEEGRKLFKGTKRGLDTEYKNFKKAHKDWGTVVNLIEPAIHKEIEWRTKQEAAKQFVPEWKNFQTWINQRCWEQEFDSKDPPVTTFKIKKTDEFFIKRIDRLKEQNEKS